MPQQVELDLISVRADTMNNLSITDSGMRRYPNGDIRVMAKVRNWTDDDQSDLLVRFNIDGMEVANQTIRVKAGSATQTSCRYTPTNAEQLEGTIVLDVEDDLEIDNTRYFSWQLPRKRNVAVVSDWDRGLRWPPFVFFTNALPNNPEMAWNTELFEPQELSALLAADFGRPDVVILSLDALPNVEQLDALRAYVQNGGSVIATLNPEWSADEINSSLFANLPVEAVQWRHEKPRDSRFDLLSWVDLTHPIFVPFNGTQFNDFSMLRFYNFLKIKTEGDEANVIGQFETDDAAIVDISIGDGKLLLWSFGLQLTQSNVPKHARFVPMLYESLWYLGGEDTPGASHYVGESMSSNELAYNENGSGEIQLPAASDVETITAEDIQRLGGLALDRPGLLKTRGAGEQEWNRIEAVNVAGKEGNDAEVDPAELTLKLAAAPMVEDSTAMAGAVGSKVDEDGFLIQTEYGPAILGLIVMLLLIESVYMTLLSRRKPAQSSS